MVAEWLSSVKASHMHCRQEEERNVNDTRGCSAQRFLFLVRKKGFHKFLLLYHPGLYHVAPSLVLGTLQTRSDSLAYVRWGVPPSTAKYNIK